MLFETIFPYLVIGFTYVFFGYLLQRSGNPIARILIALVIGVGTYWIFIMVSSLIVFPTLYGNQHGSWNHSWLPWCSVCTRKLSLVNNHPA